MTWTWAAGPWNIGPQVDLAQATSRSITWKRTDAHTASVTIAPAAQGFGEQIPLIADLWIWRDGAVEFRGRVGPHQGGGKGRAADTRTHTFTSYKDVLQRRALNGPHISWADTKPQDAAWDVVSDEQARSGSGLSITRGVHAGGTAVDALVLELSKPVRESLDTLAGQVAAGADWDLTPTGLSGHTFDWWNGGRGTDRGVVIDAGGIAVAFTDNADTANYGNAVVVTGKANDASSQLTGTMTSMVMAAPVADGSKFVKGQRIQIDQETMLVTSKTGDTLNVQRGLASSAASHASGAQVTSLAPVPYRLDAADIASRPEGRWDVVLTSEEVTDANLHQFAAAQLAKVQSTPVTWTAELRRGWWKGRSSLFVGDPFRWVCKVPVYDPVTGSLLRMAYDVDQTMTVEELTATFDGGVVVDDDGTEHEEPKVSISFGVPPTSRWRLRKIDQRLSQLERR